LGAVETDLEVLLPGLQNVSRHVAQAGRAPDFEGRLTPGIRWGQDHVGVSGGVVGVQVRDEEARQLIHADGGLRGATDHAGAAVDQVDMVPADDGDGRAHPVGFRVGCAGAQQDDAGVLGERGSASDRERRPEASRRQHVSLRSG